MTAPANAAPVITSPGDKTYEQGEAITFFGITVTVTGLPSGLSYTDGQVQGTVAADAAVQDCTVTISADDGTNAPVTATFTITVTAKSLLLPQSEKQGVLSAAPTLTRTEFSEPTDPALDVTWTAPDTDGTITGYKAQYRKKAAAAPSRSAACWVTTRPARERWGCTSPTPTATH